MLAMPAQFARRPPFVGRETQLGALKSAADAAELGETVVVLVAGEPGIGKTRLVAELASRISARTVWATCWEDEGTPAYWPWRQVVRAVGADHERAMADAIARLDGPGPVESGADPRFQLFDAVAAGLANASTAQPLVIVLDDLHWADEGSIRLLQFLARDTRPRRLAIIGTYRDTDLDPAHPLPIGLAELVRDGLHISLGGLGPRDVATLVALVRGTWRRWSPWSKQRVPTAPVRSLGCTAKAGATPSSCGSSCSWSPTVARAGPQRAPAPWCPGDSIGFPGRPGTPSPPRPSSVRISTWHSSQA
jgi:hypothetical protein